ncbi:hypothetical protein WA158_000485 [Blastocystis sp. Blastoise]
MQDKKNEIKISIKKRRRPQLRKHSIDNDDEEDINMDKIYKTKEMQKYRDLRPEGLTDETLLSASSKENKKSIKEQTIEEALKPLSVTYDESKGIDVDTLPILRDYIYEKMGSKQQSSNDKNNEQDSSLDNSKKGNRHGTITSLSIEEHILPVSYKMSNIEATEKEKRKMLNSLYNDGKRTIDSITSTDDNIFDKTIKKQKMDL